MFKGPKPRTTARPVVRPTLQTYVPSMFIFPLYFGRTFFSESLHKDLGKQKCDPKMKINVFYKLKCKHTCFVCVYLVLL